MRRLIVLTIFSGLLLAGFVFAESQKPPPPLSQGQVQPRVLNSESSTGSDINAQDHNNTAPNTIAITKEHTPSKKNSSTETGSEKNKDCQLSVVNNDSIVSYTFFLMIFTGVLAISTIGLWIVTYLAGKDTKKAANAAQRSADAAWQAATANIFMGRAYVRITSCSPGIIFMDQSTSHTSLACKLGIKNYGETPAHITDILIQVKISEVDQLLPDIPDFEGAKRYPCSNAFLVRGESIFYQFFNKTILTEALIAAIKDGKSILSLYGHVDYIDAFGNRHRGGFGQNYYPAYDSRKNYTSDEAFAERNNLTFLMQTGYNYDRQRKDVERRD